MFSLEWLHTLLIGMALPPSKLAQLVLTGCPRTSAVQTEQLLCLALGAVASTLAGPP